MSKLKIAGVIVLNVLITSLVVGMVQLALDYRAVRVGAAQGAAAFEFLQKTVAAQEKAQAAAKPPTPTPQEAVK